MPVYGGPQLNATIQGQATRIVNEAIAAIPSTPATIVFNGVNEQGGNYLAQASDSGKLISFDITSPATLTLPATSPGNTWFTSVENNGSAMLAINPNGLESGLSDQAASHLGRDKESCFTAMAPIISLSED